MKIVFFYFYVTSELTFFYLHSHHLARIWQVLLSLTDVSQVPGSVCVLLIIRRGEMNQTAIYQTNQLVTITEIYSLVKLK